MAIVISQTRISQAKEGTHGGFSNSNIKYTLSSGQAPGLLIQHVTRTFVVSRLKNGAKDSVMDPDAIDKYIGSVKAYPAIIEYWEAWIWPDKDGAYEMVDSFNLTAFSAKVMPTTYYSDGTIGAFEQKGTATFYASNTAAQLATDPRLRHKQNDYRGPLVHDHSTRSDASSSPFVGCGGKGNQSHLGRYPEEQIPHRCGNGHALGNTQRKGRPRHRVIQQPQLCRGHLGYRCHSPRHRPWSAPHPQQAPGAASPRPRRPGAGGPTSRHRRPCDRADLHGCRARQ